MKDWLLSDYSATELVLYGSSGIKRQGDHLEKRWPAPESPHRSIPEFLLDVPLDRQFLKIFLDRTLCLIFDRDGS